MKNKTETKKDKVNKTNEEDKIAASIKAQHAKEKQAKEKADEAKINEAHGQLIAKATEKGLAIAEKGFGAAALIEGLGKAISKGVNEKLKADALGLVIEDGYEPTEKDITTLISATGGIGRQSAAFDRAVTWVLGDAAVLADRFEGGYDRVVAQAVEERGIAKHTARRAYVVAKAVPHAERIEGLTFTHYSEIVNYKGSIKAKKGLEKLMEELREGAKNGDLMSCAELRKRLQELAGKAKPDPEDGDEGEDGDDSKDAKPKNAHGFLYISSDGEVFKHDTVFPYILKEGEHIVIDLNKMAVLKADGSVYYKIGEFDPPAPVKEEKAEAAKEEVEIPE